MPRIYAPLYIRPFTPLRVFEGRGGGAWYDPSDLSTMWQDSAGTTPVVADDDPVGLMLDKSGNGNHLTSSLTARPLWKTSGGISWLRFQGTNDVLETASTYVLQREWSAVASVMFDSNSGVQQIVSSDASPALRHGQYLRGSTTTAQTIAFNTVPSAFTDGFGTIDTTNKFVMSAVRSTLRIEGWLNGVTDGSVATTGTPASGTRILTLGADRAGGGANALQDFLTGRIYQLVVVARRLEGNERHKLEQFCSKKAGLTI